MATSGFSALFLDRCWCKGALRIVPVVPIARMQRFRRSVSRCLAFVENQDSMSMFDGSQHSNTQRKGELEPVYGKKTAPNVVFSNARCMGREEIHKWKVSGLPGGRNTGIVIDGDRVSVKSVRLLKAHNFCGFMMTEKKRKRKKRIERKNAYESESNRGWHPELCEYKSEHAKQEALYFYNLFAMPWEKGSYERFIDKLERKYFPDDVIDFELPANTNTKATGSSEVIDRGLNQNSRAHNKQENKCKSRSKSSSLELQPEFQRNSTVLTDRVPDIMQGVVDEAFPVSPTVSQSETVAALDVHLQQQELLDLPQEKVPEEEPVASTAEKDSLIFSEDTEAFSSNLTETTLPDQASQKLYTKPFLLKRSMSLPERWDGPMGTVVLIDKPAGWSSFSVCGRLRRLVKIQKVGHAGTLDPLATGLLIVCVGKATKLADSYQAMTKVYTGTMRLGEGTPSYDSDTPVSERLPWEHITDADVQVASEEFVGDIMQVPPIYSALQVEGERLYDKARRGEEFEIPPRMVSVDEFELQRSPHNRQDFLYRIVCSKGTYVRSLCYDLGRALNCCAHVISLRREKIGHMSVSNAWTFPELETSYKAQLNI